MLQEQTECTFNPTLISKQFKNRVCPSYDFKHARDKQVAKELAQEYDYFTLKQYLNINEESKSDLEKLCKFYSTGGNQQSTTDGKDIRDQDDHFGDDDENVDLNQLSDKEKMHLIA